MTDQASLIYEAAFYGYVRYAQCLRLIFIATLGAQVHKPSPNITCSPQGTSTPLLCGLVGI